MVQDLRTRHWFVPQARPIFFLWIDGSHFDRIHCSLKLSIVTAMITLESSQQLEKIIFKISVPRDIKNQDYNDGLGANSQDLCYLLIKLLRKAPILAQVSNFVLSHNTPCFQSNIAITNFLVSHMRELRFHDVIDQSTVSMYSCSKILKHS